MTTVEQIQAEIEQFKATVVRGVDTFVQSGYIGRVEADGFLSTVGIERPEAPEVRAAREELAALKARVRDAVAAQTGSDSYRRDRALAAFGLTA